MAEPKTLMLFTGEFPYGRTGEPFLNEEIYFLAKEFDKILVFPRSRPQKEIRALPPNATIVNIFSHEPKPLLKSGFKNLIEALLLVLMEFFQNKRWLKNLKYIRYYGYLANEAIFLSGQLQRFIIDNKFAPGKLVSYTYWFDNSNLACAIIKGKGLLSNLISRVHRFDLYDERNKTGVVPFRNFKIKQNDRVFAISDHGLKYLKQRVKKNYWGKIGLSRLGVKQVEEEIQAEKNVIPLILSCSRLESFKRVPEIAKILIELNKPIKWVHFGGGPQVNELNEITSSFQNHIIFENKGQLPNDEVLKFYLENFVDLFVSASESEGLPVTMMEAISFGVPIVAFNVGGVSEIVINNLTGVLIDDANDFSSFKDAIKGALYETSFDRQAIKSFFKDNFNAEINYSRFAKEMKCLFEE